MLRIARLLFAVAAIFAIGCSRDPVAQSKRLVQNGNKFYDKGKFKEAAIMYRKALQKDAKNGDAYYRLGLASLQLGELPNAYRAFQRAITEQPNNTDAQVKFGDILWLAYVQDPQRGGPFLSDLQGISKNLLARDPKSFDGLRIAGLVAAANKDEQGALRNFEAAHQVKPYETGLDMVYAQALAKAGRMDDAEKVLKDLIAHRKDFIPAYDVLINYYGQRQRLPEAEQLLKSMVEANPKSEGPIVKLAAFYYQTKRRPEMEAALQRLAADTKDFPRGRLTTGAFFARLREFDRARAEFDEGMKANPKDKATYQKGLAQVYLLQNKNKEASDLLATVLKEDSKDSEALAMRAGMYLRGGEPDEIKKAVADLQGLVGKGGSSVAGYRYQLAEGLLRLQPPQMEQARLQLEEILKVQPNFVPARVMLANIFATPGPKYDPSKALAQADEAIRQDPNNYRARLVRTAALSALKRSDDARQELQALAKLAPDSPDVKFQLGMLSFQDRKYQEAEEIFRQMQQVAPNDARGFEGLVEAEAAQGNLKHAVSLTQAELQKNPKRTDLRRVLGNLLARDQQYDAAIREFQQVSQEDPKDYASLVRMAEAYRLKGDLNGAVDALKRAKASAPAGEAAPTLRLGMLLDVMGRKAEARPLYEEVLRSQPNNVLALNNLAYIKADEGSDLDVALSYSQRARGIAPNDLNVADTLGYVYIKKNLTDEAIRVYRDITQKDPNNATYRMHLAAALLQKGNKSEAKQQLETAMKSGPALTDQQKIRDLLVKVGQ